MVKLKWKTGSRERGYKMEILLEFLIVLLVLVLGVLLYCMYAIIKLQKDIRKLERALWNDEYSIDRNTHGIEELAWDLYLLSNEVSGDKQEE